MPHSRLYPPQTHTLDTSLRAPTAALSVETPQDAHSLVANVDSDALLGFLRRVVGRLDAEDSVPLPGWFLLDGDGLDKDTSAYPPSLGAGGGQTGNHPHTGDHLPGRARSFTPAKRFATFA